MVAGCFKNIMTATWPALRVNNYYNVGVHEYQNFIPKCFVFVKNQWSLTLRILKFQQYISFKLSPSDRSSINIIYE